MRVEVKEKKKQMNIPEFPFLAIYEDGSIVCLTRMNGLKYVGFVVANNRSCYYMDGFYSETWDNNFLLFEGEITLSNDNK